MKLEELNKNLTKLNEMAELLKETVYFESVGIHEIVDDEYIRPIWKDKCELSFEEWSKLHAQHKQKVDDDKYLTKTVRDKQAVFVDEIKEEDSQILKDFGIKSTCLIPVFNEGKVVAFVTMPCFENYHTYSLEEMERSIEIVSEFNDLIKDIVA